MHIGIPVSFLCIFLQPLTGIQFNPPSNLHSICFHHSGCLLIFCIFCTVHPPPLCLPPSSPHSPPPSVKPESSLYTGVFITKKSTKDVVLFEDWQVNGISTETETRLEIISTKSLCFHEGTHLAREGKNAAKHGKQKKKKKW